MTDGFDPEMITDLAGMMEAETVRANGEISELVKKLETEGCPGPALVHALLTAAYVQFYQMYDDPRDAAAALKRQAKTAGEAGIKRFENPGSGGVH